MTCASARRCRWRSTAMRSTKYYSSARLSRVRGRLTSLGFYEDWMSGHYADYDPDQANALLDEIGLTMGGRRRTAAARWRKAGHRAMGRDQPYPHVRTGRRILGSVGVDVEINPSTREAFKQALLANEVHASVWFADVVSEKDMYQRPIWLRPPYGIDSTPVGGGLAWRQWWLSGGAEGEEPPEYQKEQLRLVDEWQLTEIGSDRYVELGTLLVANTVRNIYHIGPSARRLRCSFAPIDCTTSHRLKASSTSAISKAVTPISGT